MWPSLIFVAVICSLSVLPSDAIYGGNPASISDFPYQVSIEYLGKHKCGGSIVSPNHVLTTANCVYKLQPTDLKIHSGADKLTLHSEFHYVVDQVIVHENFTYSKFGLHINDVALLYVKEAFKFDSTCQSIPLMEEAEFEKLQPGVLANVTGWGHNGKVESAEQLEVAQVPLLDKETCADVYEYMGDVTEAHVCTGAWGEGGLSPCNGDEGGPLAVGGKLIGVIMMSKCGQAFEPDVYTSVVHATKWILGHIAAQV